MNYETLHSILPLIRLFFLNEKAPWMSHVDITCLFFLKQKYKMSKLLLKCHLFKNQT